MKLLLCVISLAFAACATTPTEVGGGIGGEYANTKTGESYRVDANGYTKFQPKASSDPKRVLPPTYTK